MVTISIYRVTKTIMIDKIEEDLLQVVGKSGVEETHV